MTRHMTTVLGFAKLFLFCVAVGMLVLGPVQIKKTLDARTWQPREVKITQSRIISSPSGGHGHSSRTHSLQIEILDMESGTRSSKVHVRFGGFNVNVAVLSSLAASTLDKDQEKYSVGAEVTAFKHPDRDQYVLEQNTTTAMLCAVLVSLTYMCAIVIMMVRGGRSKDMESESKPSAPSADA